MRKTIRKLFWAWEFDKEEQWLNEMAAKGLALISVGYCRYDFEESAPGEYQVCIQLLKNSVSHEESRKYIEFVEDMGAEQVGNILKWVYFRRRSSEGKFELFSDNESRIKHLSAIINMLTVMLIANTCISLYNIFIGLSFPSILNLICGILSLTLSVLILAGIIKISKKRKVLKDKITIFE